MADNTLTGNEMFEAFVDQVKQALEHLYDFAYLQQHHLARAFDGDGNQSARTAGRQLRQELITAIESFKPKAESHFRAPDARLYNILHLNYVENLTIQESSAELGLSERQVYRDLRRGQEMVASVLWNNRLSVPIPAQEYSVQSEMDRLKLNLVVVDIGAIFQQAKNAVERLAQQQSVTITVEPPPESLALSTDSAFAHQIIVSVLSYAIQQAEPGNLIASFEAIQGTIALRLRCTAKETAGATAITESVIAKLANRLHWTISCAQNADHFEIAIRMTSCSATILVIDDNEGWAALLERFLEGHDCMVVHLQSDSLQRIEELAPSAIILDVMMPEKDGWELLQRLRALPATAHIPILVCTVFNDPQLAYSLGASAFLSKPTSREKILESLKELDVI
jgi:CheY-like chemotaxis protein/predicted DNA-binding protein (UPF0251 family)